MFTSARQPVAIGLTAIGLALGVAGGALADTVLPVTNLQFNTFTNPLTQAKDYFSNVLPTGWSIGSGGGNLIYVGQQGSEGSGFPGNVYPVYTTPGFSDTVPAGTNFYQADGNPQFESTIYQTISGLVAGVTYDLEFQQAAGQQVGFSGATTEQWKVFLGQGGIGTNCSGNPCTVTETGNNVEEDSTLMNTPSQSNVNWNTVNLTFTATASDFLAGGGGKMILTFLAWGDGGSTANEPPTVFLEGVNTPVTTPEPASMWMFGAGVLALGGIMWRRRAKHA